MLVDGEVKPVEGEEEVKPEEETPEATLIYLLKAVYTIHRKE